MCRQEVQAPTGVADCSVETRLTVWFFFLPNPGTVNTVTQDESGRRLRFALRHGPLPASEEALRQLGKLRGSGGYLRQRERDGGQERCSLLMMSVLCPNRDGRQRLSTGNR